MVLIWKEDVQSEWEDDQREACSSERGAVRTLQERGGSRRIPALDMSMSRWDSIVRRWVEMIWMPSLLERSQENLMELIVLAALAFAKTASEEV